MQCKLSRDLPVRVFFYFDFSDILLKQLRHFPSCSMTHCDKIREAYMKKVLWSYEKFSLKLSRSK
jgi:hypothetical protein